MTIEPLALKPLSSAQLQADNLLCARSARLSTQFNGQPMTITLQPGQPSTSFDMTLTLKVEALEIPVQVNRSLFAEVKLGNTNIESVLDQLPDSLLMGSLQVILDKAIKDIRSLLQKEVQLSAVHLTTQEIPDSLAVTFDINGISHQGKIGTTPQILKWLEQLPVEKNMEPPARLPLLLTLEAGRTLLSSSQIQQLHIHDIIFFDKSWQAENNIFLRASLTHGFMAQLKENTITLINFVEIPMSDDHDMDDLDDFDDDFDDELDDDLDDISEDDNDDVQETKDTKSGAQPAQNASSSPVADINNVPVQLTFDVGQHEMLIGNMSQLIPGFTFQLNRPIASPVMIHANGKPLAEGELVDINGQIGARITRML